MSSFFFFLINNVYIKYVSIIFCRLSEMDPGPQFIILDPMIASFFSFFYRLLFSIQNITCSSSACRVLLFLISLFLFSLKIYFPLCIILMFMSPRMKISLFIMSNFEKSDDISSQKRFLSGGL